MTERGALTLAVTVGLLAGCGPGDSAPPSFAESRSPEILFLVKNEVMSIRLDGTARHSLGQVGDDRHRTGWPRALPDGRVALLADDTGGIFPYVGPREGGAFQRLTEMNVTLNDSLCGVTVNGAPRLVLTTTPFIPTRGTLSRIDVDNPKMETVDYERDGVILNPAPYDDGRVLVARYQRGDTLIEIVDVTGPIDRHGQSQLLATVSAPFIAQSPARLPDGRVVFIQRNPSQLSPTALGEMFVIGVDGSVRSTGVVGVVGLVVAGDRVVYEAGGADGISDLVATDLVHAPVNLTNTPFVSEHLNWSN